MNTRYLYLSSTVAALTLVLMNGSLGVPTIWAAAQALDISKIEQLTGVKGKLNDKEGVFKVSLPRKDLQVTVAGVHMTPPMGLTSWAAFTRR
jgi:hypothetical protein